VRRVLIVFAVTAVVCAAVAFPQKEAGFVPGASGSIQTTVVAQSVPARALSIGPQKSIYVTLAAPPDRLFTLNASGATISAGNLAAPLLPVAGSGIAGSLGDGGAATAAQLDLDSVLLYERSGIVVKGDGTIYVADTQNATIRRIPGPGSTEPGVIRSVAGQWAPRQNLTLSRPMGIALDRAGNLYIVDHAAGVLDVLNENSGLLETLAQVSSPASVAVTADGSTAFVASPETGAVFSVDLHTHSLRVMQGIANQPVTPSAASETLACAQGSNRICPAGLAVDGAGNLFVADSTFGKIIRVDARTGASTIALSDLQQPGALAFDEHGLNLYIAEQGLNRIIEAQNMGDPSGPLSISPGSWTYANEPIGGISPQEQFTVTNNSASALSGIVTAFQPTAPATQSDFSIQSTSCLSTIPASGSCTINVAFTPTSPTDSTLGTLTSGLLVTDSTGDSASASISGTADDYQVQLAGGQTQEVSVLQGGAATFHLQVAALGAFGQSGEEVSIICPSDTPQNSTCSVKPSSVAPTAGSPGAFTIIIQTQSTATISKLTPPLLSRPRNPLGGIFVAALVIGMIGTGLSVTRRRLCYLRLPALVFAGAILLSGCHHASTTALATPTGTAQILVQGSASTKTGTSLNATRGLTVTLDVLKN
jgi:sugar lactone lactonase YvrE